MYNQVMKLMIQIPAYNEEDNIQKVLEGIDKNISGVNEVFVLLIDDGSNDNTSLIAQQFSVDKIIKLNKNLGLSNAFMVGIKEAIEQKADILVNIDGDNQYKMSEIPKLIEPIIRKRADIVVGCRPIDKIKSFSLIKKILQKFGTFVVKNISGVNVKDAASGFRAYSREAILKMNIFNPFTYTVESIIQAGSKNIKVENVDIEVNEQKNRKSKLFKNNLDYILKQAKNTLRFFIIYKPAKFFATSATFFLIFGLLIGARFLFYYFTQNGSGHIQSLILCAIVLILSFICYMLAILGDLAQINRKLLEDIQYELRQKK